MSKTIWLNLDPEQVDITHLEQRFAEMGCKFIAKAVQGNAREQVLEMGKQADIIISILEQWDDAALAEVKDRVQFIQKYGAGLDNIDLAAAAKYGIPVANVPGANSAAVAEVALMHILNVGRRFSPCVAGCKQGIWPSTITGTELDGKTVGILGYGFIAKHLVRMLSGFDVKLLVYDALIKEPAEGQQIEFAASMEELFSRSDLVSLHIPCNDATRGIINKSLFDRMKRGAYLVNTCRGGVINEADLIAALQSGQVAAAGLDVLCEEPPRADHPLLSMDNVYVTSHMGAASFESEHRSQVLMANAIEAFLGGELPFNVKNKELLTKAAPQSPERNG